MTTEPADDLEPLRELLDPAAGVGEADLARADLTDGHALEGGDDAELLLVEEIAALEGDALEAALAAAPAPSLERLGEAFRLVAARVGERRRP